MSEEAQEYQPTAEGSQQRLEDAPSSSPDANTKGGSDAETKGASKPPSKPDSEQAIGDSKPKSSEKQNADKDNDGRRYWQLGRGIIFFCIGSFIACSLTGIFIVN